MDKVLYRIEAAFRWCARFVNWLRRKRMVAAGPDDLEYGPRARLDRGESTWRHPPRRVDA